MFVDVSGLISLVISSHELFDSDLRCASLISVSNQPLWLPSSFIYLFLFVLDIVLNSCSL